MTDSRQTLPAEDLGTIVDVGITRFAFDISDDASTKATTVGWAYRSQPDGQNCSVEYLLLCRSPSGYEFPNLSPQLKSNGGAEQTVHQILFKKDGVAECANFDAFLEFVKFMGVEKADVRVLVAGTVAVVGHPDEWPKALTDTGEEPRPDVDGIGDRGPAQVWFFATSAVPFAHGEFSMIRQVYGVFPDGWAMQEGESVSYRKLVHPSDGDIADVTDLAGFSELTQARINAGQQLVLRYGSYFTFAEPKDFWPS